MAFSTGFPSIQQKNIRNLYSTDSLIDLRIKKRTASQRTVSRKPEYVNVTSNNQLVTYEYVPEYKTYIPKAPAFRTVTGNKADEISERLYNPTVRTKRSRSEVPPAKLIHRDPTTFEDQNSSVDRLIKPTVASFIRLRMRSGKERKIEVKDITNACERLNLPPSQRYFPASYKNWLNSEGSKWSMKSGLQNSNRSSLGSSDWEF